MSENAPRKGDWMQTFTGRAFWPMDPRADEIFPADIAHALSMLCRYGGHTNRFYSVAEHCVLLSQVVPPDDALWALLHDATEAYLVDLPRPVKSQLPGYRVAEYDLMAVICDRFDLPSLTMPASVEDADNRILLDERDALLSRPPRPWHQDLQRLEPLGVEIAGWDPPQAEYRYKARLRELWRSSR